MWIMHFESTRIIPRMFYMSLTAAAFLTALLFALGSSTRTHYATSAGAITRCEVETHLDSGWVCGRIRSAEDDVMYASFRGMPYAEQPVGPLRFKELQPVKPWDDYLDATEEGPICPQYDELHGRLIKPMKGMSEACLYANVHVPMASAHNRGSISHQSLNGSLPILVVVNGAGFQSGSGDSDFLGPEYLVSKGNIVVTFNHRLNVFGYLSLDTAKIPGNAALRDIITLLRWVQRNARAFGGDPDNVTLLGHSTEAASTHLVAMSHAGKGLMKRLMLLSGTGVPAFYTGSRKYAKLIADKFLGLVGIKSTDPDVIHDQLIKMPLNQIMDANRIIQYDTGFVGLGPVTESAHPGVLRVVDEHPLLMIKEGRGKHLPLMIGITSNECGSGIRKIMDMDVDERIKRNPIEVLDYELAYNLPEDVTLNLARKVIDKYFNGTSMVDGFVNICSDTLLAYPAFKLAQWRSAAGGAPVYMYQFLYKGTHNVVKKALQLDPFKPTGHYEDLTYYFRTNSMLRDEQSFPPKNRDALMRHRMTTFMSNFMRCSAPMCHNSSLWPAVQAHRLNYQAIRNPVNLNTNREPTPAQMDMIHFFDDIKASARYMSRRG